MSRRSRVVIPGLPHHVTQRGVRKQDVFFDPYDREVYLNILKPYAEEYGVDIICYCLMTNHLHLMLVPYKQDSLRWTLQLTHKRYAEYVNAKKAWSGHLWQARFYSSPLDERFFWITARYIERNPVRAKMVEHAYDYQWSSARLHSIGKAHSLENTKSEWSRKLLTRTDWKDWLAVSDARNDLDALRKNTAKDLPTGSESFLLKLEKDYNIVAKQPKMGRPKKVGKS